MKLFELAINHCKSNLDYRAVKLFKALNTTNKDSKISKIASITGYPVIIPAILKCTVCEDAKIGDSEIAAVKFSALRSFCADS